MSKKIFIPMFSGVSGCLSLPRRVSALSLVLVLPFISPGLNAHDAGEASGIKILVIGATAKTANELIPQALWRGHEVIALARRPYRVRHAPHERLTVVRGDVYDQASIEAALSGDGSEVVVSIYGPRIDPSVEIPETDLSSQGTTNIINAMKAKGNTRLFATSSTSVQEVAKLGYKADTPKPEGLEPGKGLWFYNLRGPYIDMLKMEKIVLESGLDATVLRPGQLLILPATGDILLTVDTETPNRRIITYPDFAAFILDQVESPQYVGHTVGIYSATEMDFSKNAGNIDYDAAFKMLERQRLEAEADLAADPEAYRRPD
jgi:putative NADH-flavin reductase